MNAEKFGLHQIDTCMCPIGTPAITDVISGQVNWFFAPITSAIPMIKDHKLQALAVARPNRHGTTRCADDSGRAFFIL